ncbi:MAG TPA: GIY-YIG nuclease family protein [Pelobium sp.]|nr:GIY-YIG nuclease family protein [Pelobium sp.]
MKMLFYAYVLQSQKSGRFYIRHTQNLVERLSRHNSGMVKATKNKGPWSIVYSESFKSKLEANQRELEIKSKKSRAYIEKLIEKAENS